MNSLLSGVVVGVGHMGRHHLRKLQGRADVDVHAVDPQLGFERRTARIDFAVIAVPTSLHVEVALPYLEAGIPCLVEKPLAPSFADAALLACHTHCCPGHIERFNPAFRAMNVVGAAYVQAERISVPTSRSLDVDVVQDLMVHDLDLAAVLLDDEVVEVRAVGVGRPGAMGVDIANVRLETRQGRVANLTASRMARRAVRSLRVFTAQEYWSVDFIEPRVERVVWGAASPLAVNMPLPDGDGLDAELDAFLGFVRGERDFPVTPAQGLRALDLVQRVEAALRTPGA